ncbi:MAG: protease SohB [Ectothiorhodospiraceae bacterium]|nr:protease SohB [Ectothiorhodospiraceae bacterium]MCH8504753.1 protease SohB [Ectothiorhodospiraceae bacterium]
MELMLDYGLFLAKTVTLVAAVLLVAGTLIGLASRGRDRPREQLKVRKLNDRYRDMEQALRHALMARKQFRSLMRQRKKEDKHKPAGRKRVFVLNFHGDLRASAVENLREEVSAILTLADPGQDQVVARVESAGGLVHSYGLAASQLARIRDREIPLTVAVDKVAASGGYMMAAVAGHIQAAPFAVVGSIGVVAQIPNVHRLLKKHDVDYELLTAGQYKRTLTVFGKNTEEGRKKFQEDLEATHGLFKAFVARYRPQLDLEKTATGEHWFGEQARELGLVDSLRTSDDLLMELARSHDLYEVTFRRKQPMSKRVTLAVENTLERLIAGFQNRP